MKLYHGSSRELFILKSSKETGVIRKGEESRKDLLDVVFFSTSYNEAKRYSGIGGFVYECSVEGPVQLNTIPHWNGLKRSDSIWVAASKDITITQVFLPGGKVRNPFPKRVLI